jgi:hypothetical protein
MESLERKILNPLLLLDVCLYAGIAYRGHKFKMHYADRFVMVSETDTNNKFFEGEITYLIGYTLMQKNMVKLQTCFSHFGALYPPITS